MSLNRYEQILFDYLENRPDEKRFWKAQVIEVSRQNIRHQAMANDLSGRFWEYFEERSRYESPFREVAVREGLERISMLNLSEYLLRVWADLPVKKKKAR
tara:strand:- start:347 stop:646 length:300 start_codon:yes stop_codon:yes gene_type:complete